MKDLLKKEGQKGADRQLDGMPFQWTEVVEALLKKLPSQVLQNVVVGVLNTVGHSLASSSWALQLADLLRDSQVARPLPQSLLHALIVHCKERRDPYGVVEVLYLAEDVRKKASENNALTMDQSSTETSTTSLTGSVLNFSALRLGAASLYDSNVDDSAYDRLSDADWRKAIAIAWHGHLVMPKQSFQDNFTEVVRLMRQAGLTLDESSTKVMMRFLISTQPESPTTKQIFDNVNENKALKVCHVECIALSKYIMHIISTNR